MASRAFSGASSRVAPYVITAEKAGTTTVKPPPSFRLQDDPVHAPLIHGCVLLRLHPAPGRGLDAGVP
jgi:hypothetical protein